MTRCRLLCIAALALLWASTTVHPALAMRARSSCPGPATGGPDVHGTIDIWAGQPATCTAHLIGGITLQATGGVAPQIPGKGHAVFRIIGAGLDAPGGVTIIATASKEPTGPETERQLNADAVIIPPPGAILLRWDPLHGRFVRVPNGHVRLAGLYRVIRAGASPLPQPAPPRQPTVLPATGSSPLVLPLGMGAALAVPGLILLRRRGDEQRRSWTGLALLCSSGLIVVAVLATHLYAARRPQPAGFGLLAAAGGHPARTPATSPPTRLVIARLGIDTPVIRLGVANGAWQTPSYAAGYLDGSAWPGHGGNETITGHDDRDGSVFRRLGEVHPGDLVQVYAGNRVYRYAVTALRIVAPSRVDVLRPTGGATLTLITCTPYLIDTQRLVIRARLLSE